MNGSEQLTWYGGDLFQQDQDLIDFIQHNHVRSVKFLGDCQHVRSIVAVVPDGYRDLCAVVINSPFRFSEIVKKCNEELLLLPPGGLLYLSLNKFLALSEPQPDSDPCYDRAIHDYICRCIPHSLVQYHSGLIDDGRRFNWAHPLTRFFFRRDRPI